MSSADQSFGSNNPFRQKFPTSTSITASANAAGPPSSIFGLERPAAATPPPLTTFKSAVSESERQQVEEDSIAQRPKKIVKKVRVQSPPPSSPEDAVPVTHFPTLEALERDDEDDDTSSDSSDSSDTDEQADPFNGQSALVHDGPSSEPPLPEIPLTPFARTLHDIEEGSRGDDITKSNSKGSLDVDSFKRLLLTGYANLPKPGQAIAAPSGSASGTAPHQVHFLPDGSSNTDASSMSRHSILDVLQETPRTSHEMSESEAPTQHKMLPSPSHLANVSSTSGRKKPPPPSSRHGKLIKIDLGAGSDSRELAPAASASTGSSSPFVARPRTASGSTATVHSPPATDVNKPLPAPPLRASADEDAESPFDREAAGKVPEAFAELQANPRAPTPPPTFRSRSESQNSTQPRRPVVPPPRRHGRSDSRVPSVHSINADEEPPRSSMESTRSRTDSLRISMNAERALQAPAPPPPRRPGHVRQSSYFTAQSQQSFQSATSPGVGEKERSPSGSGFTPIASPVNQTVTTNGLGGAGSGGPSKLSPPPPPPTRKQSMRRPPSVRGVEGVNGLGPTRKVSREKEGGASLPPPPPPRARGSARPNASSPAPTNEAATRRGSSDTTLGGNDFASPVGAGGEKQGVDILADLDALQREVDELMKKSAGAGG
ncbi:hypothetical protein F5Y17DRAFT_56939 [Xylariaceae sp. FL0594]|nr:hypothetical protein F5Y17DRAFT_56939 [Xylariaceae sp. FL0594]